MPRSLLHEPFILKKIDGPNKIYQTLDENFLVAPAVPGSELWKVSSLGGPKAQPAVVPSLHAAVMWIKDKLSG